MSKDTNCHSYQSNNPPDWYWANGLHDACIIDVDTFDFPYDYNKYLVKKGNSDRNILTLKIDASNALFDTRVKEIRFFNYKILSDNIKLEDRTKIWWVSDILTEEKEHYVLEVECRGFDSCPEVFTFKIRFDRAEVYRS